MKNFSSRIVVLCIVLGLVICTPVSSQAKLVWRIYDDFSSGSINPTLWNVDTSGGTVSVVNIRGVQGKVVKFVQTNPAGKARLIFKDSSSILGIQAKVFVVSYAGDLRGRIGAWAGLTQEGDKIWQAMDARPSMDRIQAFVEADDPNTLATLYTLFYNYFQNPLAVTGKWYTMTLTYPTVASYSYAVAGQGKCTFTPPSGLVNGGRTGAYIGTKSSDGAATGTVYFDNIKVLENQPN